MPSYRPPVSRDQYHQLEAYYFKLVMFTDSADYKDLHTVKRDKIDHELAYMQMSLDIMALVFDMKEGREKRVVAWQAECDEPFERIFHFSCIKVAHLSLGCNQSKISAVCRGVRKATGGWFFMYEENYEEVDPHELKIPTPSFKE